MFVAPSYPRDVVVEATSQATVQVQWSPPIPTNGIIMRYRVSKSVYHLLSLHAFNFRLILRSMQFIIQKME